MKNKKILAVFLSTLVIVVFSISSFASNVGDSFETNDIELNMMLNINSYENRNGIDKEILGKTGLESGNLNIKLSKNVAEKTSVYGEVTLNDNKYSLGNLARILPISIGR